MPGPFPNLSSKALVVCWLICCCTVPAVLEGQTVTPTVVSAGSFRAPVAPDSLVSIFGQNLAATTQSATADLPTTLGGVTVSVRDTSGTDRQASLVFVSPGQINLLMPAGLKAGQATVRVDRAGAASQSAAVAIANSAPGLFSANGNGAGVAAASVTLGHSDGSKVFAYTAAYDQAQRKMVPAPIDMGVADDQVILTLYGTGIRHATRWPAVTAGGEACQVLFAGAQGQYRGLDQVNVRLPLTLLGRGEIPVILTADDKAANTVTIAIATGPSTPRIDLLTPASGTLGRTVDTLTVRGVNLQDGAVAFSPPDGITAKVLTSANGSVTAQVTIDGGAERTARQVRVTTAAGVSNALPFQLYYPSPQITDSTTGVFPLFLWGGQTVQGLRIYGDDLDAVSDIRFATGYGLKTSNVNPTRTLVTFDLSIATDASGGANVIVGTMVYLLARGGSQLFPVNLIQIRGPIDPGFTISNLRVGNVYLSAGNHMVPVTMDFIDPRALASDSPKLVRFQLRKPNGGAMYLIDPNPLYSYWWRPPVQAPPAGSTRGTLTFEIPLIQGSVPAGQQMPIMVMVEGRGGRLSNQLISDFTVPQ